MFLTDLDVDAAAKPSLYRTASLTCAPSELELRGDTIYLIDGGRPLHAKLSEVFIGLDASVVTFPSTEQYLGAPARDAASCVVLNIRLADLGSEQFRRILEVSPGVPLIIISDPCDAASAVRAMKAGAADFFIEPFDVAMLTQSLRAAMMQDRKRRQRREEVARLLERFALLTPREREVFPLVIGGLLNKQAAGVLGISEVTLQIHRSQVMRKMRAESFADLVRMAMKLRISPQRGFVVPSRNPKQQSSALAAIA